MTRKARRQGRSPGSTWPHHAVQLLSAVLLALLIWAYVAPGPDSGGLAAQVDSQLTASGVQSRVTAVLLNFRGYDTMLECFVLLLGVMVVWSLRRPASDQRHEPAPGPILLSLERLLVPLMVMVGGYLLWAGSSRAGGAFQAGAILGGAGVLLLLDDAPFLKTLPRRSLVWGICLGPLCFVMMAVASMVAGRHFLEYRFAEAGLVIVLLEAVAAFSIGLCLATLFGGRPPARPPGAKQRSGKGKEAS